MTDQMKNQKEKKLKKVTAIILAIILIIICMMLLLYTRVSPLVPSPRNLEKDNTIPELYNVEFNEDFQTVSKKIKCTNDSNFDSVMELGGLSICDCTLYSKGNTFKWIYGVKVKDIICSFDEKGLHEVSIGFSPSKKNFERLLKAYSCIFDSSTKYTGKEENYAFWQTTNPSRQVYLAYDEEKNDLFICYKDMR